MKTVQLTAVVTALLCLVVMLLVGCSESDGGAGGGTTAEEHFTDGVTYLEDEMEDVNLEDPPWTWDVDLEEANAHFEDALDVDPDHCGALLLAAVTRMGMVLQDEELGEIMDDLFPDEQGLAGLHDRMLRRPDVLAAARRLREQSRDDLPFSDLQDYIEDHVIPALEYADEKMTAFEDDDCVVILEIELEEERETVEIEIDATDVYLVHAPLDILQAVFFVAVSYNFDAGPDQTLQELIEVDPDFTSLRPGNHMPAAFAELSELYGHLLDCAASMEAETDPQDNDIFTATDDIGFVPMGIGAPDTLEMIADAIEDGLVNGVTFNPYEDTGEPEAPDIDVMIDIEEMFTDPLDPIRDYLAAHTWEDSMTMELVRPIDMPDPTMSDITPGMTDDDWNSIYEWLDDSE